MPPTLKYERYFLKQGFARIAGVDEVGVGCLAGPVLAAAVILPFDKRIKGLDDSKKLTPSKRELLFQKILKQAKAIGLGIVDPQTIDKINILKATQMSMRLAVDALKTKPDFLLIDGNRSINHPTPQLALVKGDSRSYLIAAASIVAKVIRDRIMDRYDDVLPQFGFKEHKGYGTLSHRRNILRFGPSAIHRQSFALAGHLSESHNPLDIEQLRLYNSENKGGER